MSFNQGREWQRLGVRSLWPCLGQGASVGDETVLADSGRAGEVAARVGWVGSLVFLSILLERSSLVQDVPVIEVPLGQNSFSIAC
jgi:hypothetical protein